MWNTFFGIAQGGNMRVAIIGYAPDVGVYIRAFEKMGFSPDDIIVCEHDPEKLIHFWSEFPQLQEVRHMHELMYYECDVAIIAVKGARLSQTLDDVRAVGIHNVLFMEDFELDAGDIAQISADNEKHVSVATDASGIQEFIESCRST